MLIGIPPFYHKNETKIAQSIVSKKQSYPSSKYLKISEELKSLIDSLLIKEKEDRLGANGGLEEIKTHPFFAGFNWDDLYNKKLDAPFIPDTDGD